MAFLLPDRNTIDGDCLALSDPDPKQDAAPRLLDSPSSSSTTDDGNYIDNELIAEIVPQCQARAAPFWTWSRLQLSAVLALMAPMAFSIRRPQPEILLNTLQAALVAVYVRFVRCYVTDGMQRYATAAMGSGLCHTWTRLTVAGVLEAIWAQASQSGLRQTYAQLYEAVPERMRTLLSEAEVQVASTISSMGTCATNGTDDDDFDLVKLQTALTTRPLIVTDRSQLVRLHCSAAAMLDFVTCIAFRFSFRYLPRSLWRPFFIERGAPIISKSICLFCFRSPLLPA